MAKKAETERKNTARKAANGIVRGIGIALLIVGILYCIVLICVGARLWDVVKGLFGY